MATKKRKKYKNADIKIFKTQTEIYYSSSRGTSYSDQGLKNFYQYNCAAHVVRQTHAKAAVECFQCLNLSSTTLCE